MDLRLGFAAALGSLTLLITGLKYPGGWIRTFSSAGPGIWALVRVQKTACYFKLSHQFWGLWGTSHAVTLGYPPFGSLESSLLPPFSTLRSILALMLCPWVFRRGHFCPVKSLLPSPQALLGKAFVLWSAAAALPVEMLRWTYLSSPALPNSLTPQTAALHLEWRLHVFQGNSHFSFSHP